MKRKYCPRCAGHIVSKMVDDRLRDVCSNCETVYYDNPLPVVSAVVCNQKRELVLVLRDREPYSGQWALPSGFVELNESVENAVIRELKEETGIDGYVTKLLDTFSHNNEHYGDLIWVTFEVSWQSGELKPGDDARETRFFHIDKLPEIAFTANRRAVDRFKERYKDLWAMQESFNRLEQGSRFDGGQLPSDALFEIISRDVNIITENWVSDVMTHPSTRHYASQPIEVIYQKADKVIGQFAEWINYPGEQRKKVWDYYKSVGHDRRKEGFLLSEVISAMSLTRKHIFAHALGQNGIWRKPMEIYLTMEFISRVNLFFDKAVYHISRGFEDIE